VRRGMERLFEYRHPDPYVPIYMPGGSKYQRNVPPPPHVRSPHSLDRTTLITRAYAVSFLIMRYFSLSLALSLSLSRYLSLSLSPYLSDVCKTESMQHSPARGGSNPLSKRWRLTIPFVYSESAARLQETYTPVALERKN